MKNTIILSVLEFPCFNGTYNVDIRNAKAASNIPSFFQAAYAKNFYEIVFVVCDKDRNPEQYVNIISKLDDILGPGKAKEIVIFTCPCTLQVILSHFGDVQLTTQAKKKQHEMMCSDLPMWQTMMLIRIS